MHTARAPAASTAPPVAAGQAVHARARPGSVLSTRINWVGASAWCVGFLIFFQVMASTLPRSFDTCKHFASAAEIEIELYSQLNPIDKGIYEGKSLKEISQENPQFYQEFEENRLHTRFPGGMYAQG